MGADGVGPSLALLRRSCSHQQPHPTRLEKSVNGKGRNRLHSSSLPRRVVPPAVGSLVGVAQRVGQAAPTAERSGRPQRARLADCRGRGTIVGSSPQ